MIWLLALLAGFAVYGIVKTGHHRIRRHGIHAIAWRWLTGQPWHGKPLTDRGWLRPGARALTRTGHASRFAHLPRWRGTLWRSGPTLAVAAILYGLIVTPALTAWLTAAAIAALAGFTGWLAWVRLQQRKYRRAWLNPLHMSLASTVGVALASAPSYLAIEPDRGKAVITLPQAFDVSDEKLCAKVAQITALKLGLDSPDVSWEKQGPQPKVTLTRSAPPPKVVKLDDVREVIEIAPEDVIVLGTGRKDAPVDASLSLDSPHIGLSCGAGGGKSVTGRVIGAQILHKGGLAAVLDYKMTSQAWARGLPNVAYADTVERIHRLLLWLEWEMERRNEVACAGTDIEGELHASVGPRIFIIAEEMNATMTKLRRYWARERAQDRSLPARSPAVDAFENLLFMGRQARMNMLAIAQKLSARAAGSGDARENMGTRILGRATGNNWKALVDDFPYPGKTTAPGRMFVVTAELHETQIVRMSGAQARQMALSGAVAAPPANMPCIDHRAVRSTGVAKLAHSGPEQELSLVNGAGINSPGGGGSTLRELIDAGVVRGTILTLRTLRSRDPAFPKPVGVRGRDYLYDPVAAAEWQESRR